MGKYGKVTDTEIKWLIICKSVTMIIFVEFIDPLIDYPINCANLTIYTGIVCKILNYGMETEYLRVGK